MLVPIHDVQVFILYFYLKNAVKEYFANGEEMELKWDYKKRFVNLSTFSHSNRYIFGIIVCTLHYLVYYLSNGYLKLMDNNKSWYLKTLRKT